MNRSKMRRIRRAFYFIFLVFLFTGGTQQFVRRWRAANAGGPIADFLFFTSEERGPKVVVFGRSQGRFSPSYLSGGKSKSHLQYLAQYIDTIRKGTRGNAFFIDVGGFAPSPSPDKKTDQRVGEYFQKFESLGGEGIILGPLDLALGREFFEAEKKSLSVPFLATNLLNKESQGPLFNTYIQKKMKLVGGMEFNVAVISLIKPTSIDPTSFGKLWPQCALESPSLVLERTMKDLAGKVSHVFLVVHDYEILGEIKKELFNGRIHHVILNPAKGRTYAEGFDWEKIMGDQTPEFVRFVNEKRLTVMDDRFKENNGFIQIMFWRSTRPPYRDSFMRKNSFLIPDEPWFVSDPEANY